MFESVLGNSHFFQTQFRQYLTHVKLFLTQFRQYLTHLTPFLTQFRQYPTKVALFLTNSGNICPTSRSFWSSSAYIWPALNSLWPNSGSVWPATHSSDQLHPLSHFMIFLPQLITNSHFAVWPSPLFISLHNLSGRPLLSLTHSLILWPNPRYLWPTPSSYETSPRSLWPTPRSSDPVLALFDLVLDPLTQSSLSLTHSLILIHTKREWLTRAWIRGVFEFDFIVYLTLRQT